MSDFAMYNLLRGTGDGRWFVGTKDSAAAFGTAVVSLVSDSSKTYQDFNIGTYSNVIMAAPRKGDSLTLTFWCRASAECVIRSHLYSDSGSGDGGNARKHNEMGCTNSDGLAWTKVGTEWACVRHTWTYDEDAGRAPKSIVARLVGVANGITVSVAGVMLVKGDTPAAWAPAEGETLAGGGAQMSANLLDGATVTRGTKDADGYWVLSQNDGTDKWDSPMWRIDGQAALAENQTMHMACSVMPEVDWPANACLASVKYMDSAGNANWASGDFASPAKSGTWTRLETSATIPSGMRVTRLVITNSFKNSSGAKLASPTLSYGSPVTLASSAHTPYATQDHVMVTYATKAQLKVTDDSVKAEVSARAQTDRNVADLSSRLTQTANSLTSEVTQRTKTDQMVSDLSSRLTQTADGFNASIDRLSDTDKKVNSWFGFGADASGNPQLTMGSSSSPVVGVYTNTGLAYKARSGATLLELDGASRSSTMPHVHADDVSMGSWQWVPTQNGTHFTLQWIGG